MQKVVLFISRYAAFSQPCHLTLSIKRTDESIIGFISLCVYCLCHCKPVSFQILIRLIAVCCIVGLIRYRGPKKTRKRSKRIPLPAWLRAAIRRTVCNASSLPARFPGPGLIAFWNDAATIRVLTFRVAAVGYSLTIVQLVSERVSSMAVPSWVFPFMYQTMF